MDARACFFGDSFRAGVGDEQGLGWVGRVVARARADGFEVTAYNLGVRRQTGPRSLHGSRVRRRRGSGTATPSVSSSPQGPTTRRLKASSSEWIWWGLLAARERVADLCATRGWSLLVVFPALGQGPVTKRPDCVSVRGARSQVRHATNSVRWCRTGAGKRPSVAGRGARWSMACTQAAPATRPWRTCVSQPSATG
jgi:hypothetical protein